MILKGRCWEEGKKAGRGTATLAAFGREVIIWGGIPSVMLCEPVSDQAFADYMLNLFRTIAPGDAFILGVADNVMAEAKLERIERVSEMVQAYGKYPIQIVPNLPNISILFFP